MDLYQGSTRIKIPSRPKPLLKKLDFEILAFVLGTHNVKFPALCVTVNGEQVFSRQPPVALCQQLEDEWQAYYFYTRQPMVAVWEQLVATAVEEGETTLGQFPKPMRVATCGGYSFWSPNPGNDFGLWFITPTCQNIQVHDGQVDFTTTDASGHVTHWTGKRQTGESPLVSQARVDLLADYVWRKAILTRKVALQLVGNMLVQQKVNLKAYPRADIAPMFPLNKWFFEKDLDATVNVLYGHSPELAAKMIELQYINPQKK